MVTLPVHVWLPNQALPVLAGEFSHDGSVGRFAYARDYLVARHPALAPDLPLREREHAVTRGHAIFPLFLDAGPDTWGRHLLERRLERPVTELEALAHCPTDGVGNIVLGELTQDRQRILSIDEFMELLAVFEAGGQASNATEEQVLDAAGNGTSLGGTKPKLTLERDGQLYLAKFPEKTDSPWLPHIECATLKLAQECGLRVIQAPEVWRLSGGRAALLVRRFDRVPAAGGHARLGFISAHALLRLDALPKESHDVLSFATQGFTAATLRKSYVALAEDMQRWTGGHLQHREECRELWRRIVFNVLIRNLDDHTRNHGLLCVDMDHQHWHLSPAYDLVPSAMLPEHPSLCLAYRFVPGNSRRKLPPRLVSVIDPTELIEAASDHFSFATDEARDYLHFAAGVIQRRRDVLWREEGIPEAEIRRFDTCFEFARQLAGGGR